jgi:hypothetical protein
MHLDLSDTESQLLGEVLGSAVNQLTTEIAHTDNAGYRRDLKVRRLQLRELLDRFGGDLPNRQAG